MQIAIEGHWDRTQIKIGVGTLHCEFTTQIEASKKRDAGEIMRRNLSLSGTGNCFKIYVAQAGLRVHTTEMAFQKT